MEGKQTGERSGNRAGLINLIKDRRGGKIRLEKKTEDLKKGQKTPQKPRKHNGHRPWSCSLKG